MVSLDQAGEFLPISIDAINQFSRNTTNGITSVGLSIGISGTEIPVTSDTIETRYAFPMNYEDSYTSNGYSYLDLNPIYNAIWIQYRTRITEVDGYGSITTPYGTFDVLRIRHEIIESDSVFIDLFEGAEWYELPVPVRYEYVWITKNEKEPILKVVTRLEASGEEAVISVNYKDNFLDLNAGIEETQNSIQIGPNPVINSLVVQGISGSFDYQVIGMYGEVLQKGTKHNHNAIDLNNINPGTHLIVIDTIFGRTVQKIIKQ